MTTTPQAILITGASTGIGAECALHFDRLGYRVYAGVRREEDGNALAARASDRLRSLILDVTDAPSLARAALRLNEELQDGGLFGLVNNAGIAVACPLELIPLQDLRMQFEVNVVGVVAVTQAFLPLLRQRRGRIVNMGSISGLTVMPALGPYCASKFALEAITDALRIEVQSWGIDVAIIEPGAVATPIWEKSIGSTDELAAMVSGEKLNLYRQLIENVRKRALAAAARAIPPAAVVAAVEHALTAQRPKTRYIVGNDSRIHARIAKLLPDRWMDRFMTGLLGLPKRS